MKPFLKYPGGKSRHMPKLKRYLRGEGRLIEPFMGSGAVFMGTSYQHYVCADINPDLIHLYRYVKARPDDFIRETRKLCQDKNNSEDAYYRLRNEFNASDDTDRRSQIFYYLNHAGFNGLIRYSKNGFNVPYGRFKHIAFKEKAIRTFSAKANATDVSFLCADFTQTMSLVGPNDDVYLDPPYTPLTKTSDFTAYSGKRFKSDDHDKLADLSKCAVRGGARVVLSDHDTPQCRARYQGSHFEVCQVARHISARGTSRKPVSEVLVDVFCETSEHDRNIEKGEHGVLDDRAGLTWSAATHGVKGVDDHMKHSARTSEAAGDE